VLIHFKRMGIGLCILIGSWVTVYGFLTIAKLCPWILILSFVLAAGYWMGASLEKHKG